MENNANQEDFKSLIDEIHILVKNESLIKEDSNLYYIII